MPRMLPAVAPMGTQKALELMLDSIVTGGAKPDYVVRSQQH
jgi:hypothetical protein